VRRQWIPKPGTEEQRPLGIPAVRDRTVQAALRNVLEPIFERRFAEHSYGFRPGRSCKDALRRVDALMRRGFTWVVDADIQRYFDTIDRSLLMIEVKKEVADGRVLDLLERLLQQSVMDGLSEWTPEEGTPQGSVISPMLANVHLHPVDLALNRAGFEMVRYADDLVILCETEAQAHEALRFVERAMAERRLTLHPQKTRVVDAMQPGGFDFLGYHFEQGERRPRKKSLRKFKDKIRALTPRNSGHSLRDVIARVNATVRGWFGYFKHSHRWVFSSLDGWIRRRLRAILLRRHRRRGIGRGKANIRWPNAYFVALGLFTMATAREAARQSR
jgi:RNA-directed DNA polymerase